MKFAICNELFEGWAFGEVCRFVKAAGYTGLELAPFTLAIPITGLSTQRRAELAAQARDEGVEIIGLHWLLAKTEGLHLTSPDPAVRARTSDYLVALAEACRDLGGHVMVFGSPSQRSLLPDVSWARAFELATETFRAAMPRVSDCGVTICMEPLTTDETNFVNTCEEAVRLIEAVGHRHFVLQLDVKAMSSESIPVSDLIRRHADRTGHFHANDSNRGGPGSGPVDFGPIFQALSDTRYPGWVSVEVFDFRPDPETIARNSIDYMRQVRRQVQSTKYEVQSTD